MDPVRLSPGSAAHRPRVLSVGRQSPVPVLVQQGQGSDLAGRGDLGCRRKNCAESDSDVQSRGEGAGDQARADLYERAREKSERQVQMTARMRGHPRASGAPEIFPTGCGKTTQLNVAAGLLHPASGTVTVLGAPLAGINSPAGDMFQTEALTPW